MRSDVLSSSEVEVPTEILRRMRSANRLAVLTGAGVSAESGIATFRGESGMWEKYDFRKLATPEAFEADPRTVWEWYQMRQIEIGKASPNPAHVVIADMESRYDSFMLLTQNIDGLHARAGNKKVLELHGNIWRARCTRDGMLFPLDGPVEHIPPFCQCGSLLRPDVVWFGEQLSPDITEAAFKAATECDLMFVVGTSAVVYPAAALPVLAKDSGATVIEVNLEPSGITSVADFSLFGRAGELLPVVWKMICGSD